MDAITLFGFDVGARRIGIAVGNTISMTASEVGVLEVFESGPDWPALDRWIKEWRPQMLVVGDPATLDGGEQPMRKRARAFGRALVQRYQLPVEQVDERTSSVEAAQRFASGRASGERKRRQAAQLDALAAAVILERWLREPDSRLPLP
ncbi:MAG TPA: Holliday junction resolvase RuvX [Arenimonas sp.]|uniref:Holliday junction resolvase RuvX n=1 Tax=Arenimonas sp. TaxID=1872635 RepID=UPI002C44682F|nr:Holliday junction resolvase RuvX [Arenimonas sp.]HMB56995.1 Holliday junction resolvase RuvX [Arenimonas sp.]